MFSVPILRSKLIMPQNPKYLNHSERIQNLCRNIENARVTAIVAPAGYGKTSLAAAALQGRPANRSVFWYRMEPEDADVSSFYSYLIESFFPNNLERFQKYRRSFDDFGDISSQYRSINVALCDNLFDCYGQQKEGACLVLDDFQNVSENELIVSTVRFFIDNFPNNFQLILISRSNSGVLTEKQKLENNVFEVGYRDLLLTRPEIVKLAEVFTGSGTTNINNALAAEGWAAGVIMTCQSGPASLPGQEPDRIRQFDYFTTEILKSAEASLLQSLVKIALLDDFTPESAEQILGLTNVSSVIAACESKGLFLQKFVGETTYYRFHGLFRNVLLQLQDEQLTAEQLTGYHVSAADYYKKKGIYNKAIEHYIAGGNIGAALQMIMEASRDLSSLQSMDKLKMLFSFVGNGILENNPHMMYMKSFLYQNGEEDGRRLLNKAYDILLQSGDYEMALNALFSLVSFYLFKNDLDGLKEVTTKALAVLRMDGRMEASLSPVVLFVQDVWEGKTDGAARLCREIDLLSVPPSFVWTVLMYSSIHYIVLGKQDVAESKIQEIFGMEMVMHTDILCSFALLFASINAYLKDNTENYYAYQKQLLAIAEKYNILYVYAFSKVLTGMEQFRKQNRHLACAAVQEGIDKFEQLGNRGLTAVFSLLLLLYQTADSGRKEAFTQARELLRILEEEPAGFFLTELGIQLVGAIAVETEQYPDACRYLKSAEEICSEKKELGLLCETLLTMAALCYKTRDDDKAAEYLQRAFFIASSRNQVVFPCVLMPVLVHMAAFAVQRNIYQDYAFALIESNFGTERMQFFKSHVTHETDLNYFCLRFFSTGCGGFDKSAAAVNVSFLDKFSIKCGDIRILSSSFKTKKDAAITQYLFYNKNKPVSREVLTEMFWPEADKKSGSASMRSALYGIRKLLAESGITSVTQPLIRENNGFLEITRPDIIIADVEQFLALDREIRSMPAESKNDAIITASLEKMFQLYNEDFLADGTYDDWAYYEREKLKLVYLCAVFLLVSRYETKGEPQKAEAVLLKALSLDPCNEELSYILLKIYIGTNRYNQAVKFYGDFKKTLLQELDVEPDAKLESLFGESAETVSAG